MARDVTDLERLLDDLESDQVERKSSMSEPDRVCEAICAFANDLPNHRSSGVVFIGVNDDGIPTNLPITDDLLTRISNLRDDGKLLPFPTMSVRKVDLKGSEVAVVEVEPSLATPVRFRGRVWIRVGPRRGIASADDERRLSEKRRSRDLTFDARPLSDATLDDLDIDLFEREYLPSALPPDVLEANERTQVERLSALRLATLDGNPTAAGLILIGAEPTEHVPGCYVQFLRMEGTELTGSIVDEKVISGSLISQLRQLDEVLTLNIQTAIEIGTTLQENRRPDYPLQALQQVARNALLHRSYESTNSPTRITWYSDRLEITSPGGPFGSVSAENFGQPGVTDYRNPVLAEAMRNLGYVQRFGMGIPLTRKALSDNNNPEVEFSVEPNYISVTLRSAK